MKRFLMELEDKERMHIAEWTKQLDDANEKVCLVSPLYCVSVLLILLIVMALRPRLPLF